MLAKLKSRKLWAAIAGTALTAFGQQLGLEAQVTLPIVAIVVSYILGQSAVDAAAARQ